MQLLERDGPNNSSLITKIITNKQTIPRNRLAGSDKSGRIGCLPGYSLGRIIGPNLDAETLINLQIVQTLWNITMEDPYILSFTKGFF